MGAWDAVAGALLVVLGSYVFLAARSFPNLPGGYPGPGLFPQLLGAILTVSGMALVGHAVRTGALSRRVPLVTASRKDKAGALLVVLSVVLYIVLVDRVGFVPLAFLILAGLMLALGAPAWRSVGLGAVLTAFLYLLFGRLLNGPLPRGLLP